MLVANGTTSASVLPGILGDRPPTYSNVVWTADDTMLVASGWATSQRGGLVHVFDPAHGFQGGIPEVEVEAVTGLALDRDGALVIRHWRTPADRTLVRTRAYGYELVGPTSHRASNHVVVIGDQAITGSLGAEGAVGLHVLARDGARSTIVATDVRGYSALTARRDGEIVAGGRDGELDAFDPIARAQRRLRFATDHPARERMYIYNANSIVAMCTLADDRVCAVSADGVLTVIDGDTIESTTRLPIRTSVRAIAAHPDRPIVAIGIKVDGAGRPSGAVMLVEIEEPSALVVTERLTALATTADADRAGGGFDPPMLEVLADAVEEAGAPARWHTHLRDHDPRLRDCWLVDHLLGRVRWPSR